MTESSPIPPEPFATAIASLDREAFAGFVAELWAGTAGSKAHVDVDPPLVTVRTDDVRTRLLVVPATESTAVEAADLSGTDGSDAVDSVIVAAEEAADDVDDAVPVVTPADLRNRLLYGLDPADSGEVCEAFLGRPSRSPSYSVDRSPSEGAEAPTNAAVTDDGVSSRIEPGSPDDGDPFGDDAVGNAANGDGDAGSEPTATERPARSAGGRVAERDSDGRTGRIVATAVVLVLLLATVVGAASLAGVPSGGDGTDRLGSGEDVAGEMTDDAGGEADGDDDGGGDDPSAASGADGTGSSPPHYYAEGIGNDDDVEAADSDSAGSLVADGEAAERAVGLEPTCERTPLHVVQIQMNALRYNDPETNDGIRTTRRFASPRNRQAVGTFEQFVDVFDGTSYEPMLTHDSVRYTPLGIDGDRTTVRVVTYENGSATASYEFRMRNINASDVSSTEFGGYDGCWMTDAVSVSSTPDVSEPAGTNDTEEDSTVRGPSGT